MQCGLVFVFQRRTPVRSCCAPSKKRWVSLAGHHFGLGGKFALHSRLERILHFHPADEQTERWAFVEAGCLLHACVQSSRENKRGSCSDYLFSCCPALSSLFGVINSAHRWSDMNSVPSEGFLSKLFHTGIITEFKWDSCVDSSLSINLGSVASANHTDHQPSGLNGNH